jgi:GPH family glycoside/pentoside/hexuronide:cation symporter
MALEGALPRRVATLYASGAFSGNVLGRVAAAWLFYFYASGGPGGTPRMSPWLIGTLLTVTTVVGAFFDPLVGYWSDRTRSRWGRRLPFIALATPCWALAFLLLWTPPVPGESRANAFYFLAVLLLFRLSGTLSGGPLEALLPEIAPDNASRVRIVVGQVFFGTLGAAVALIAAGPVIDRLGFPLMAAVMAALALGSRFLALAGVWWHAERDTPPVALSLLRAVGSTFRNDQFLFFLPTFCVFNMGTTLMTAALPFYAANVFAPGEERVGSVTALLTAAPIVTLLLSLPLVQRLALRRGKAWVYAASMLFGALYFPLLFFMGFVPGLPTMAQGLLFLAPVGLAMTGVFVFPNALMADIIDYDAHLTGHRREATYYATQNLIETLVLALHSVILAGLLDLGGTPENPLGIRLVGPVAGLSIFIGWLIFRRYTLPDTVTPESVRAGPAAADAGAPLPAAPPRR